MHPKETENVNSEESKEEKPEKTSEVSAAKNAFEPRRKKKHDQSPRNPLHKSTRFSWVLHLPTFHGVFDYQLEVGDYKKSHSHQIAGSTAPRLFWKIIWILCK